MIEISSPTRLDLAGGTLDLWPIWSMLGDACTINMSIDIQTHCFLQPREDKRIFIESLDFKKKWEFENLSAFLADRNPGLKFYQVHVGYWKPADGFKLRTQSESPVGGGLGGSSSLSISMFKSFMKWLRRDELGIHEVVRCCADIEAEVLQTPTGVQDYYPAAQSGLNIIDFSHGGPEVSLLEDHKRALGAHFFIVYTGKTHHSGINNWQVFKKFVDGDKETVLAIRQLRDIAYEMKELCLSKAWEKIPLLFEKEYRARMILADSFSSPEIEKLKALSVEHGAQGMKICGAGGGGCVLVWCHPETKSQISQKMMDEGFQVLEADLV